MSRRYTISVNDRQTCIYVDLYVDLAGDGQFAGEGGLYRYAVGDGTWQSTTQGIAGAVFNPLKMYAAVEVGGPRVDPSGRHGGDHG